MQNLQNKVALVTGGSRGIGAAIVKRLAQEGATVVFTYVHGKEQAELLVNQLGREGLQVEAVKADNTTTGEVSRVIEDLINKYNTFDILVNNAGIYVGKAFQEHTLEDYEEIMSVNVRAVVEACIKASQTMSQAGRVITIGSNMAERVSHPQATLYSMSKSALIGLTKGLARDLGSKGITVNLVQPGPVNTDMNPDNSESATFQRSLMAIPQYGNPQHIAQLVAYLASPEASYTTGAIFTIDGGTTS